MAHSHDSLFAGAPDIVPPKLSKGMRVPEMLDVMGLMAGRIPGGMSVGIIVIGILMGAATGIVGATVVTVSLLSLPTLLKRGYHKGLACGTICASGTLGQIIPPSLINPIAKKILDNYYPATPFTSGDALGLGNQVEPNMCRPIVLALLRRARAQRHRAASERRTGRVPQARDRHPPAACAAGPFCPTR